jgi:hypothetical protein
MSKSLKIQRFLQSLRLHSSKSRTGTGRRHRKAEKAFSAESLPKAGAVLGDGRGLLVRGSVIACVQQATIVRTRKEPVSGMAATKCHWREVLSRDAYKHVLWTAQPGERWAVKEGTQRQAHAASTLGGAAGYRRSNKGLRGPQLHFCWMLSVF